MKRLPVLLLLLSGLSLTPRAAAPGLLEAVRAGDTPALSRALADGASPNSRDDSGTSALMYATVYGTVADMTALLDAGADVNAANAFQSTAAMWAANDAAKLRLLIERGAKIDARAADRTNALAVAVRFNNVETMRLLMAKGADPRASAGDDVRLLRSAYTSGTSAVRQLLAERGVAMKDPAALGTPFVALNARDTAMVRQLLDLGASPREQIQQATLTLSALMLAASQGATDTVRLLIDRGADPSEAGTHGWTPLMMAAAAPVPNLALVQLLIDKGSNLAAKDDAGRTALDWARTTGETPMAALLKAAGAPAGTPVTSAPATAVATPRDARGAVERAIARLQPIGPPFYEHNKCISCHNQSLPAMAVRLARARGISVDAALAAHPSAASLETWKAVREQVMLGNGEMALGGFAANLSYGMVAMAEEALAPNAVTDAMAYGLAMSQRANGSFNVAGPGEFRPPIGSKTENQLTALSIRALTVYAPPGRAADTRARLARALEYVRSERPTETQDHVFKLLGLIWGGGTREERDAEARNLLALQRSDGGWAQLPTLQPDAFATGQALFALHLNGLAATTDAYRKGAEYLRRTQLDDGSWFVRSRAFGFQPYFDAGFPHGKDQFISAAATSWAAIALSFTL